MLLLNLSDTFAVMNGKPVESFHTNHFDKVTAVLWIYTHIKSRVDVAPEVELFPYI